MKSFDRKLANIRAGNYTPQDFIIADAKDADMAFGLAAPGPASHDARRLTSRLATRAVYLDRIRAMARSGLVDIMLTSASAAELLSAEGLYADSDVTPAVRYNDTTDIWYPRGGRYGSEPPRPVSLTPVQHRAGRQVAMNHAVLMRMRQRGQQVLGHPPLLVQR